MGESELSLIPNFNPNPLLLSSVLEDPRAWDQG